ncbi:hypothetical protein PAXRUDRAFT_827402 [Paxillus rubicundulus Ve08.2h10]|uniref:Uncharacterized protein n=1 Tax=Paxillus rubicundulus Ve08.2h10 TaxID=930991 RepID=A0A0D0DQV7_9AGAM|nr:hypothetical protein PAXRUDRAFT_827402 [Paxillus rubicundulus Ve08.2h10]
MRFQMKHHVNLASLEKQFQGRSDSSRSLEVGRQSKTVHQPMCVLQRDKFRYDRLEKNKATR